MLIKQRAKLIKSDLENGFYGKKLTSADKNRFVFENVLRFKWYSIDRERSGWVNGERHFAAGGINFHKSILNCIGVLPLVCETYRQSGLRICINSTSDGFAVIFESSVGEIFSKIDDNIHGSLLMGFVELYWKIGSRDYESNWAVQEITAAERNNIVSHWTQLGMA